MRSCRDVSKQQDAAAAGRCLGRSGETARCEHTKRWFILPILYTLLVSYDVQTAVNPFHLRSQG
jgi:hypothetical protein